jgi:hypothetical protein
MSQYSTGIFPREGFNLDAECAIPLTTPAAAKATLKHAKTIRVIVLGATGIDNAGTNKITVTVGGQAIVFQAQDLDANGVGIAHIRGALCDINNNVVYVKGGTANTTGVFYELVDGVSR